MKRLIAAFAVVAALVGVAGAGAGPLRYGVADDWPKYHPCGDVWWNAAKDIGYQDLRMTVQWDASTPATIPAQSDLKTAIDCAQLKNVNVILAIYPLRPSAIGSNAAAQAQFARFVALVGQAFPAVKDFIVGNEPNVNRFWQPQFANGHDAAATDYEHTLAQSYDALKVARPDAVVWGPAVSSRGNDNANAKSNPSHSPVWFIKYMGDAYRASGRTKPIFDEFNMHPYPPVQDKDPFSKPFQWPQAGAANLDRIKQALWDAFNGTGQPVPAEQAGGRTTASARFAGQGLPINLDEAGEQTVVTGHESAYDGSPESITPIDEATQAARHVELAEIAACDPDVKSVLYFDLIDEKQISSGFQSGELFADLQHKQSYAAMKNKIASAKGQCQGGVSGVPQSWTHATTVIGAQAIFGGPGTPLGSQPSRKPSGTKSLAVSVTANEDANYSATLVNASGTPVGRPVTGLVQAYYKPAIRFKSRITDGTYTVQIVLTAATNPSRKTILTSQPFAVGKATVAKGAKGGHGKSGSKGKPAKPSKPSSPTTPTKPSKPTKPTSPGKPKKH